MFTRILVPTDFSPPSDAALSYARLIGGLFGASQHLLHVATEGLLPPHEGTHSVNREPGALKQLRDRVTDEDRKRRVVVRLLERSDPAYEIPRYAHTSGVDLIVMGTHGRTGVAHLLMGSVAEKVVRTAHCPVLTVHKPPRPSATGFERILVAIDFSEASDAALDYARVLARQFGASLHLLHVLEDVRVEGAAGAEVFIAESPEARSARLKEARARLSRRLTSDDRARLHATSEVIFGTPDRTIADYADDNGFDLIVMGTHGRTGMAHLLMGSVAEKIVRVASCPVLTTRQAFVRVNVAVPGAEPARASA